MSHESVQSYRFVAAAAACVAATRQEAGCLAYDFFESVTAPGEYVTVEHWQDDAALDAHFQTPHVAQLFEVVGQCVSGAPLIEEFVVSERHLR